MSTAPSVFILGAGPVAMALAGALATRGQPPVGLWARRAKAAKRAGEFAGIPHAAGDWPQALRDADVIVFAVSDDSIASLANRLAADGVLSGTQVLLHCAGSRAAGTVFSNMPARGVGLLHPLRAIASAAETLADIASTTFGIEGDTAGRAAAEQIAAALGASVLALEAHQLAAYHAAAAIASNYLVSVLDLAEDVLAQAGIEGSAAREAFADLAQGALDNVRQTGLPKALTGPIRRGDVATVRAHAEALAAGPGENLELYRSLGRRCLVLSQKCGDAEAEKLTEIASLLAEPARADPPEG